MMKWMQRDRGSALVVVLVFVTIASVWLGAALFLAQSSALQVNRAQAQDAASKAQMTATALAIRTVTDTGSGTVLGLDGSTDCGLPAGVTVGDLTVTCEPLPDSGAVRPLAALMLLGTGTNVGLDSGLSVADTAANKSNVLLDLTGGDKYAGGIYNANPSAGGGWALNGNGVKTGSSVLVPSGSSCGAVSTINCVKGSSQLSAVKTSPFWQSVLKAIVPVSGTTAASVPSCTDSTSSISITSDFNTGATTSMSPAAWWSNGYYILKPGYYGPSQLAALNYLTANINNGGALDPADATGNTKCPGTQAVQIVMKNGWYLFDFDYNVITRVAAPGPRTWMIQDSRFSVISEAQYNNGSCLLSSKNFASPKVNANGSVVTDSAGNTVYATYSDQAMYDNTPVGAQQGVQIRLAGDSQIYLNGATMDICPIPFRGRPQVSVAALDVDSPLATAVPTGTIYARAYSTSVSSDPAVVKNVKLGVIPTTKKGTTTYSIDVSWPYGQSTGVTFNVYGTTDPKFFRNFSKSYNTDKTIWDACLPATVTYSKAKATFSCTDADPLKKLAVGGNYYYKVKATIGTASSNLTNTAAVGPLNLTCEIGMEMLSPCRTTGTVETLLLATASGTWCPNDATLDPNWPSGTDPYQLSAICVEGSTANNTGSPYGLRTSGLIFLFPTSVSILHESNGVSSLQSGLIAKAFRFASNSQANPKAVAFKVKPPRQFNGDRWVKLTVKNKSGSTLKTFTVHIKDNFAQNLSSGLEIVG